MISKVALFFATVVALMATAAATLIDAQAAVLTSPGSGRTSSVEGIPVSMEQFNNGSMWGIYAPFAFTSAEIAASTGDMILIQSNDQSAMAFQYNVIWNFTTAESTAIRTWLSGVSLRNNVVVSFTATWDAQGRFAVDTSTWTFSQQSLMPYGMTLDCNLSALVMGNRRTLSLLPAPCSTVMVPAQKNLAVTMPFCLTYLAKTALTVDTACQTVRAFLETVYCTDGSAGVDAVCSFNHNFLPSGVAGPVVLTVSPDGLPGSPSSPPGGAAGAVSAFLMAVVIAVVAFVF